MKRTLIHTLLACSALALLSGPLPAAEPPIYGSQLMTRQERIEHRAKLRAARSAEERQQIRADHHAAMQEKARAQGVTLPDQPPAAGGRMGPGGGMGPGMGGMGGMGGGMGGMGPGAGPRR